jgi:tetratricopeptide (TPR) repeat protein
VPARILAGASAADEAAVLDDLDALTRADLARLGNQGWATAHDLIAETVATRLDRSHAARLHAALARALEFDDADPAELARHLLGAGDGQSAANAFTRAAQQRLDRFANEEAESLAESGLELAPSAPVRAALHEARADARSRRGDLTGARSDLRAALSLVQEGARRSRILSRMAMLAFGAEDLVRAAELVEVALAAAGSDRVARAHALAVGAITDMNLERPERAAARSEEALTLFELSGDPRGVADILDGRAMGQFLSGDIASALGAFDRVARLFEDAGDLLRIVTPRSTRGHGLVFAGRPELGLADTTEALELARALGHPEGQAYALWHQTEALSALGRYDEGRESAEEALKIAEAIGHRGWTATALRALGIVLQDAGALDEAEAAFRRSLELSEHLSLFASWASARLALVSLARGDSTAAEPFVARALSEGPPLGHYEARLARAELAAAREEPEAAAIARDAMTRAESGGHHASVPRLAILGQLP